VKPSTSRRQRSLQRVGVVLAAYQPDQQLFEGQLESIRAQDHPDWFCVVTMDSPMLTVDEAPWIRRYYEDKRFHFYQNDTKLGVLKNFERGSHIALDLGAEAIAFSDQDDYWHPNKVSRSLLVLNQQPPLSATCCDAQVRINGELQSRPRSHIAHDASGMGYANRRYSYSTRRMIFSWGAWGKAMMFDAQLVPLHSFTASGQTYHDGHISVVASLNGGITFFPEPLFDYNIHSSNLAGIGAAGISKGKNQIKDLRRRRKRNRKFLTKWIGARRILRDAGWKFIGLRFFLSTYVGTRILLAFLLLEEKYKYKNGHTAHGIRKNPKAASWFLRRWLIPRMRIYQLLFSRRRSAPRRRS
jgi:hypothetical protein